MPITNRIIWLPLGVRLIQYTDAEDMLRILKVRQKRLDNTIPYLKLVAGILRVDIREQFADGGDPRWKSLATSTVAMKALMGYPRLTAKGNIPRRLMQMGQFGPHNILIRAGRLRDAWGRKDSPDHYERIDTKEDTVRMGPRADRIAYAAIHQKGGRAGRGRKTLIPARPVRITDRAMSQIVSVSQNYFTREDNSTVGGPSIQE